MEQIPTVSLHLRDKNKRKRTRNLVMEEEGVGEGWGGGGEQATHSSNYPCPLTAVCAQRPVGSHTR